MIIAIAITIVIENFVTNVIAIVVFISPEILFALLLINLLAGSNGVEVI